MGILADIYGHHRDDAYGGLLPRATIKRVAAFVSSRKPAPEDDDGDKGDNSHPVSKKEAKAIERKNRATVAKAMEEEGRKRLAQMGKDKDDNSLMSRWKRGEVNITVNGQTLVHEEPAKEAPAAPPAESTGKKRRGRGLDAN